MERERKNIMRHADSVADRVSALSATVSPQFDDSSDLGDSGLADRQQHVNRRYRIMEQEACPQAGGTAHCAQEEAVGAEGLPAELCG